MSTWRVFAERADTADFSSQRIYQPFIAHQDIALKSVLAWIVFHSSPVFSTLTLGLWATISGVPTKLISTATCPYSLAQITTLAYACKQVPFIFPYSPSLKAGDTYALVLGGTGYTGDDSSHLSLVRGVPDPTYALNVTVSLEKAAVLPFKLGLIGAVL